MGRKKKPFIDKKRATSFHLVPRSQADPLLDDPLEPQHVLKLDQAAAPQTREERLTQQRHYGVHYSDEYDYLQHLKQPGTAVLEPVRALPPPQGMSSAGLPGSMFGSEVEVKGQLSKVLPVTGPQPNWDPDIVAGLDNPDLNFDLDDQLEDDFVLQANGGEPGVPVYVTDNGGSEGGEGEGEGEVWWMDRGDFAVPSQWNNQSESVTDTAQSECTETDQSESSSTKAVGGEAESKVMPDWTCPDERVATFTDYSISSSVVPRNKGLTQLDERFEKFMAEYEDGELGAPELEEREGEGEGDQRLLDLAVRDFEKNFSEKVNLVTGREVSSVRGGGREEEGEGEGGRERQRHSSCDSGEVEGESEREERGEVMVEAGRPEWDCESILSTYSNLYNHPTKIAEPSLGPHPIPLSKKTGIPLGTILGPLSREKPAKQMPVTRPRQETTEERRERKRAVKEERKFRRSEKKATKVLFHSEQLRQERVSLSQRRTAAVV